MSTGGKPDTNKKRIMNRVAIIGSGAYGSYAASLICELHPDWEVHIYEVGGEEVKDQDGIGFYSEVKNGHYEGLTKGRYFGYGGATNKWGGQILTFSENDFKHPDRYQKEIVELNRKYKQNIFRKVGIKNDYQERVLSGGMFTKTGVWLDYFSRNLFKKFKIARLPQVKLHPYHRVCKLNIAGRKIVGFDVMVNDKKECVSGFERYILAAGAFESTRLLMVSGILDVDIVNFSDHINKKVFKIKSGTKLGPVDFRFFIKKFSFITTRIVGERNDVPFFIYPTYNEEFPFFQNLKKLLFGRKLSLELLWSILRDTPSFIAFVWYFFILRKLYVHGPWYLVLHIENFRNSGQVALNQVADKFRQPGVTVDFNVRPEAERLFNELVDELEAMLAKWGVEYERVADSIHTDKFEDEYHPCALYSDFSSVEEYFNQFENMLVIHSGVLPHAGGINSTAAAFPLVEEYVRTKWV